MSQRRNLQKELLEKLKTLCDWLREASGGKVDINIEDVDVSLYVTFAEGEDVIHPVYVEDVPYGCELLVDVKFIFNGNFIRTRADLLPRRKKIVPIWISPPDEADINLEKVEDKKIKKEKKWIKEIWDIAKRVVVFLIIQALKQIMGIDL